MSEAVPGFVMVFCDEHGRPIAHVADFERDAPGGFSLQDAQRLRCKRMLGIEIVRAYASPQLSRAFDAYEAERVMQRLVDKHGCRIAEIPVGYKGRDDNGNPKQTNEKGGV